MNIAAKINQYKDRIISICFSGLAVIVAALVATGFNFEWENLLKWSFYIKTATNYAIMIVVFNTSMNDTINLGKTNPNGELAVCKKRTDRKVKIVRDEHLESIIDEQAKLETEKRRINACNKRLNRHTYGLELLDNEVKFGYRKEKDGTLTELTEEEFYQTRKLSSKQIKKVKRDINIALNSQVDYIEVTGLEILTGYKSTFNSKCEDAQMSFDEAKERVNLSLKKSLSFLLIAAVLEIFAWDKINYQEFLVSILLHATVILGAIMSGIKFGANVLAKLVIIETNRASFLNQAIPKEIQDKYVDNTSIEQQANKVSEVVMNILGDNQKQIRRLDSKETESITV